MVVPRVDGDVLSGSAWNTNFAAAYDVALGNALVSRRVTLPSGYYPPETDTMLAQAFTSSDHIDLSSISNLCFADSPSTGANYSVYFAKVLDDHSDSSVGALWNTSGTVSEGSNKMRLGSPSIPAGTSSATADGTGGIDFKALGVDSEIVCQAFASYPGAAGGIGQIRFANSAGGSTVTLVAIPTDSTVHLYNIVVDYAGGLASVYQDGISQSAVDISSLSNWYLQFKSGHASGGSAECFLDTWFEGYLDGSLITSSYVSTGSVLTAKSNVSNAYVYGELYNATGGDFTLDFSANGGSGFNTGKTLSNLFNVTNTGTDVVIKLHKVSSTVTAPNINIVGLRGFGVLY